MRLADILDGSVTLDSHEAGGTRQFLAYARVSTDDQERAGLSIPARFGRCSSMLGARGS